MPCNAGSLPLRTFMVSGSLRPSAWTDELRRLRQIAGLEK